MKCLPLNKLAVAKGNILHDWHAEVVAIRAFNRYLLDECVRISSPPYPASDYIRHRNHEEQTPQPFTIRDDVSIHMYCSEAPCGDASMELTMAAQADATPWTSAPPTLQEAASTSPSEPPSPSSQMTSDPAQSNEPSALRGRSNFSHLGVVRAKPSRPDAPPTLSKSCTDKLTLKQSVSLLSSTTSLLISPQNAYLATLVLPASQYVPQACERAFSSTGRLRKLADSRTSEWLAGYKFRPFTVKPTTKEFAWSRRALAAEETAVPSNLSAVWTPHWQETLIGGVLQGRKQLDPRGASRICRRALWIESVRVAGMLSGAAVTAVLGAKKTYAEMKSSSPLLEERNRVKTDVKAVLKAWPKNTGDEDWSLD
jgi:tRNA-specific adenosine deaminase 1